jgi:hypothetical protein
MPDRLLGTDTSKITCRSAAGALRQSVGATNDVNRSVRNVSIPISRGQRIVFEPTRPVSRACCRTALWHMRCNAPSRQHSLGAIGTIQAKGVSMPATKTVLALRVAATLVVSIMAVPAGGRAYAEPISVLDQSSTAIGRRAFLCCDWQWAQTFTSGVSGTLTRVDLYLGDPFGAQPTGAPLAFDVRHVRAGTPGTEGDVIATRVLDTSAFVGEGFYQFDVQAARLSVTAGERLAIVLTSSGPDSVAPWTWRGSDTGEPAYAGGAMFFRLTRDEVWSSPLPDLDLAFRTFVRPGTTAATPEPGTFILVGLGVALRVRRRFA